MLKKKVVCAIVLKEAQSHVKSFTPSKVMKMAESNSIGLKISALNGAQKNYTCRERFHSLMTATHLYVHMLLSLIRWHSNLSNSRSGIIPIGIKSSNSSHLEDNASAKLNIEDGIILSIEILDLAEDEKDLNERFIF